MTIPPLWQTPFKGRITAMTFGTIFAVQELYFFLFFYLLFLARYLLSPPTGVGFTPPPKRSGKIRGDISPR